MTDPSFQKFLSAVNAATVNSTELKEVYDEIVRDSKNRGWNEGYWQGVDDQRTSDALELTLDFGIVVGPNRTSPYVKR